MLNKFLSHVKKDFLPNATNEEKKTFINALVDLIKANLLVVNHEEFEKVTLPSRPHVISNKEIEILKSMSLQMLKFELARLAEEKKIAKKKGETFPDSHTLDFSDTIFTSFEILKEICEHIKKECLAARWEVSAIDGLTIELVRPKRRKKQ